MIANNIVTMWLFKFWIGKTLLLPTIFLILIIGGSIYQPSGSTVRPHRVQLRHVQQQNGRDAVSDQASEHTVQGPQPNHIRLRLYRGIPVTLRDWALSARADSLRHRHAQHSRQPAVAAHLGALRALRGETQSPSEISRTDSRLIRRLPRDETAASRQRSERSAGRQSLLRTSVDSLRSTAAIDFYLNLNSPASVFKHLCYGNITQDRC